MEQLQISKDVLLAEDITFVLPGDAQDITGRLRPRGLKVIGNRGSGFFMEENMENLRRFIANGYCWPPEQPRPERLRRDVDDHENAAARAAFHAAIDTNIMAAKTAELPPLAEAKGIGALFGRQVKCTGVDRVEIPQEMCTEYVDRLLEIYGLPKDAQLSDTWRELLWDINPLWLYTLSSKKGAMLVASAWITPLCWDGCSFPQHGDMTLQYCTALQEIVDQWQGAQSERWLFTCFTVGFSGQDCNLEAQLASDSCLVLSAGSKSASHVDFTTSVPHFPGPARMQWSLWDRLIPLSWGELVAEIENALLDLENIGFFGTMSVQKLSEETGRRAELVEQCFRDIAKKDHFLLKKEGNTLFLDRKSK